MKDSNKIILVAGARPNFMKIAPLMHRFTESDRLTPYLVHTGQHYDEALSERFFRQLGIPEPDINLDVGSASHAVQTAEIMKRFEPVVIEQRPQWVMVVGDVNSTVASALVSAKLGVKVAHVEAGLRSFDRTMPEEINRVLTDAISDALFVSEPSGLENLRSEGVPDKKMFFVGNVMIDTLEAHRRAAADSDILDRLDVKPEQFALLTLHRPSNVDRPDVLGGILDAMDQTARKLPILWPIHPRARGRIETFGLWHRVENQPAIRILEPLGYLDFLKLEETARVVLTDSGGIQEETTILGTPCLTLRDNTERPITCTQGTNRLVGSDGKTILAGLRDVLSHDRPDAIVPDRWDGRAAERIRDIMENSP